MLMISQLMISYRWCFILDNLVCFINCYNNILLNIYLISWYIYIYIYKPNFVTTFAESLYKGVARPGRSLRGRSHRNRKPCKPTDQSAACMDKRRNTSSTQARAGSCLIQWSCGPNVAATTAGLVCLLVSIVVRCSLINDYKISEVLLIFLTS